MSKRRRTGDSYELTSTEKSARSDEHGVNNNHNVNEASDEQVMSKLICFRDQLSSQNNGVDLAFQRNLREYVVNALPSLNGNIVVTAASVYLNLLSTTSSVTDELTFSACLHHLSRILKTSSENRKCTNTPACNRKTFLCIPSGHIRVDEYAAVWKTLIRLIDTRTLSVSNASISSLLVQAFLSLLSCGKSPLLHLAVKGMASIFTAPEIGSHVIIATYKTALHLVRLGIPALHREALTKIILLLANQEQSLLIPETTEKRPLVSKSDSPSETHSNDNAEPQSDTDTISKPTPVLNFLKQCCIRAPEKSDCRSSVAQLVFQVLCARKEFLMSEFEIFLMRTLGHRRSSVRLLSLELAALVFQENSGPSELHSKEKQDLLRAVFNSYNDKVPTVRAKAIQALLQVFRHISEEGNLSLQKDLVGIANAIAKKTRDPMSRVRKNAVDLVGFICVFTASQNDIATAQNRSAKTPESAAKDQAGEVKSLISLPELSEYLQQKCSDVTSLVRQAAMNHLTQVVLSLGTANKVLEIAKVLPLWVEGVLPLMNDTDARTQDFCLANVKKIFLDGCVAAGTSGQRTEFTGSSQTFTHLFLAELGEKKPSTIEFVRKAILALCKKQVIEWQEINFFSMIAKGQTDSAPIDKRVIFGAWIVVEAIAAGGQTEEVLRAIGHKTLVEEIVTNQNNIACATSVSLIRVLKSSAKKAMEKYLTGILFLKNREESFRKSGDDIASIARLQASLCGTVGDELLKQCEAFLAEDGESLREDAKVTLLHIVGSTCVNFKLHNTPPSAVITFVEAMASNAQSSSSLRALAIATLGKICLCEGFAESFKKAESTNGSGDMKSRSSIFGESLARRFTPVFVHELENATSSATRNNAVIVLCDLCRQYTAVVEPFMPRLAALLVDPSEFVRVQVISSLLSLLQEDYIKIRTGALFFQISKSVLDSSETVRTTAEHAILKVIPSKNPSLLAVSFVELIFVLNDCKEGAAQNSFASSCHSKFLLHSSMRDFSTRQKIYDVFLRGISVEHRLRLPCRFRTDIITNVLDGKLDISVPSVEKVVEDVLILLPSDPLNPFTRIKSLDDIVGDGIDESLENNNTSSSQPKGPTQTKKAALLKKVQESEMREATIPCLLELRLLLEKRRSPMLKVMMQCLCSLLYPHQESLESIIKDSVIRSEIVHQLSKGMGQHSELRAEKAMNT